MTNDCGNINLPQDEETQ